MATLSLTRSGRIIAGTVIALALSLQGALAQANKPVAPPKQVGAWTVIGWSQGYCSAQRVLRGAAANGENLEFFVVRVRIGYRIALSAPDWTFEPHTAFPVELIANPVWRGDAAAIAVAPKVILIDLGASGAFMKKLAAAPAMEVKTAQATLTLPFENIGDAISELDACYASLERIASNPFAPLPSPPDLKTARNSQ